MKNIEKFQTMETYNQLAKYEDDDVLVMSITVTDMTEEQKEFLLDELFKLSKKLEEALHTNVDVDLTQELTKEELLEYYEKEGL